MAETTVRPTAARAPAPAGRPGGRVGWAWPVLAVVLLATGAFLLRETRGTTFWFDEWQWVLDRRGDDLSAFLAPHNGHLTLVPVALYKLLFATAGLENYTPYRVMVVAAHLGCVALLFAYARRRVGDPAALGAAVLLLVLGPAWQNILWPFQVGWLVSLAAGVGALLALDRGDRRGDVAAAALLALALASSGLGVVIALGIAVELLVARGRRRAIWIAAAPLGLYAIWWIGYQDTDFIRHNLVLAPGFAADAAAGAVAALTGLTGPVTQRQRRDARLGPAARRRRGGADRLAGERAAARPAAGHRLARRAARLLAAHRRAAGATRSSPDSSRYLYVGALFLLLLATELARGVRWSRPAAAALAAAAGLAVLANLGDLREAGATCGPRPQPARADLAALELGRPHRATMSPRSFPGYPFLVVRAGPYRDAAARARLAGGHDCPSCAALPEAARAARRRRARADPRRRAASGRCRGAERRAAGGRRRDRRRRHDRRRLRRVPARGRRAGRARADAAADGHRAPDRHRDPRPSPCAGSRPASPIRRRTHLRAGTRATLRIAPDGAPDPWHVRVAPEARLTACTMP